MTGEFHLRLARPGEEDVLVQFLDVNKQQIYHLCPKQ